MKIMIVGHKGMLGREVVKAVERMGHEPVVNEGFRLAKDKKLGVSAKAVINCAGLVPQKEPTPWPYKFMQINGLGPWLLADLCDQIGARLIHVSTDCVFDGNSFGPYIESEIPLPMSTYGKSKLAGEVTGDMHLTVRTSFIGFGKRGLITELQRCVDNDKIYKASDELYWTGHTARFVAEALVMFAERNITGLLHIPGDTFSRYVLVNLLKETLDLDLGISRELLPEIDRRLKSKRWAKEGLPDLPSFEWQLEWLSRSR